MVSFVVALFASVFANSLPFFTHVRFDPLDCNLPSCFLYVVPFPSDVFYYVYVFCCFVSYPVLSGCPCILLPFYPPFVCFLCFQAPLVLLVAPPDYLCSFCLVYTGGFLYFGLICIWLSLILFLFPFCCHRYKYLAGSLFHSFLKYLY